MVHWLDVPSDIPLLLSGSLHSLGDLVRFGARDTRFCKQALLLAFVTQFAHMTSNGSIVAYAGVVVNTSSGVKAEVAAVGIPK